MNQNTIKTIRLSVAYENEFGRILWNQEWRIFTIEAEGKGEDFYENVKQCLEILHGEINDFREIIEADPENEQARDAFVNRYEIQLFMSDSETYGIRDKGEWDSHKAAMREMFERMVKDILKEHPEMINHIPPEMRHRFQ